MCAFSAIHRASRDRIRLKAVSRQLKCAEVQLRHASEYYQVFIPLELIPLELILLELIPLIILILIYTMSKFCLLSETILSDLI